MTLLCRSWEVGPNDETSFHRSPALGSQRTVVVNTHPFTILPIPYQPCFPLLLLEGSSCHELHGITMSRRNRTFEISNLPPSKQKAELEEPTNDSVTEESTVVSVSSDDSFGPQFALNAIRHSVLGKVKSSAKGLATRSSAKITPLLKRGSDAIAFKPRKRREVAPLTEKQIAARRRRRDNAAKIRRMLQRINQDPFVASRVVLALAALCLLLRAGDRHLAACLSLISLLILHQTTQLASTKALKVWYYVSAISLGVSVGSWILLSAFSQNLLALPASTLMKLQNAVWVWSRAVPRLWGLLVAFLLYREVETSRDGDDNSINTIEIDIAVLQARFVDESHMRRRYGIGDSVTTLQHGPLLLGKFDTRRILADQGNPKRAPKFQTAAFSHFIESSKGSSIQLIVEQDSTYLGTAKVAIPLQHDLKMSCWFPIRDSKKQVQGHFLVEIQSRPQPAQFLIRASTILPIIACFVLAGIICT